MNGKSTRRKERYVEKYIQWVLTLALTIRLAVVASEICEIPRHSPKIPTYRPSSSRSSKVIDLVVNRKLICNFLLVINSNFGRICYRFRDIAFSSKIACFLHVHLLCLTPPSGGTRGNINVIYIHRWEVHLMDYNSVAWHYRSIFIRLAVVAFQNREITRNSEEIWPYSSSRSSKVIDLDVNRKLRLPISH